MAASNVNFYRRQKELQEFMYTSEQERLRLEQEMNAVFKSDQRLAQLKAAKLQSYWQKVCENERKSRERNEQIIESLKKIEAHALTLTDRTAKLWRAKQEYEEYMIKLHPRWKEMRQKQAQSVQPPPESIGSNRQLDFYETRGTHNELYNISERTERSDLHSQAKSLSSIQPLEATTLHDMTYEPYSIPKNNNDVPITQTATPVKNSDWLNSVSPVLCSPIRSKVTSTASIMENIYENESQSRPQILPKSDSHESDINNTFAGNLPASVDSAVSSGISIQTKDSVPSVPSVTDSRQSARIVESQILAKSSNTGMLFKEGSSESLRRKSSSLSSSSPLPELCLDGLVLLLRHVQGDMAVTYHLDGYYRSQPPDATLRRKIIHIANTGGQLSGIDMNQASMVILEQLTLLVRTLSDQSLLSDELLLIRDAEQITEDLIVSQLSHDGQYLWGALLDHFTCMLHHHAMTPQEIAAVFVPGLVSERSQLQDKAFSLLVNLLEGVISDAGSDSASITMPSHPRVSGERQPAAHVAPDEVPPLSLGSMISVSAAGNVTATDDESDLLSNSFSRSRQQANAQHFETDAYKNMLSGTMLAHHKPTHDGDDDTDDDVEKEYASVLSPRSPTSHPPLAEAPLEDCIDEAEIKVESRTSSVISPPLSPTYIPTDKDNRKPSTGALSASGKKPVFMRIGSDLDSDTDIDLPLSPTHKPANTANQLDVIDDFDFYG